MGIADQRVRGAYQLVMEGSDGADPLHQGGETAFQAGRSHGSVRTGGKDDALSRSEVQGKTSRDEKVFPAVEAAAHLVRVGDILVPERSVFEFRLAAALQVQVRKTFIKIEGDPARNLLIAGAGGGILMGQVMDPAECQERLQAQTDLGGRADQGVLNQQLVLVRGHHQFLGKNDFSDFVGHLRHRIRIEIDDVFVSAGFIDIPIAVDAQVETLAPEGQALVQRAQQDIAERAEGINGNAQQAVVAPRIAGHDGRVAIGTGLRREDDFPAERIAEIDQFGLVEFQKSHGFSL